MVIASLRLDDMEVVLAPAGVNVGITGVLFFLSFAMGFQYCLLPHNFGLQCPEATSGHFVQKLASCYAPPDRGIPFRTVILFSRRCPSMNPPKSTRKNAIPGILRELHFDEVCTSEITFLQFFCIMEVCGEACLWLYPEYRTEARQDLQLLNAQKMGEHEAGIEKIKSVFIAILRDIKKDMENVEQPGDVTSAMFQAMQDALAEQKQTPISVDDVTAMIAEQIGQLVPMDEETADLFQKLAKKMIEQTERRKIVWYNQK